MQSVSLAVTVDAAIGVAVLPVAVIVNVWSVVFVAQVIMLPEQGTSITAAAIVKV